MHNFSHDIIDAMSESVPYYRFWDYMQEGKPVTAQVEFQHTPHSFHFADDTWGSNFNVEAILYTAELEKAMAKLPGVVIVLSELKGDGHVNVEIVFKSQADAETPEYHNAFFKLMQEKCGW